MRAGVTEQLRDQNNGTSWLDCNAHGLPHRWQVDQVPAYWRCLRCPVGTRTESHATPPRRFLGAYRKGNG